MASGIIFKIRQTPGICEYPKNSRHIKICAGGKNSFTALKQMLKTDHVMRIVMSFRMLQGSRFVTWECQGSAVWTTICVDSESTGILLLINITSNYSFIITVKKHSI